MGIKIRFEVGKNAGQVIEVSPHENLTIFERAGIISYVPPDPPKLLGTQWSLETGTTTGAPYIRAECDRCRQGATYGGKKPEKEFQFQHCAKIEAPPAHICEQFRSMMRSEQQGVPGQQSPRDARLKSISLAGRNAGEVSYSVGDPEAKE